MCNDAQQFHHFKIVLKLADCFDNLHIHLVYEFFLQPKYIASPNENDCWCENITHKTTSTSCRKILLLYLTQPARCMNCA